MSIWLIYENSAALQNAFNLIADRMCSSRLTRKGNTLGIDLNGLAPVAIPEAAMQGLISIIV